MYSLYIHIPFCQQKCFYCDFVSLPGCKSLIPSYLEALFRDMEKYRGESLSTIFIGGGTPSLLSCEQINRLFLEIRNIFSCKYLSEVTFEANPESLSNEKIRTLKICGVNRISIGVQSFIEYELRFLGRIHKVVDFNRAYVNARKTGFSNINVDLIYGLINQNLANWKHNLEQVISYEPEHISIYPLTIEPGTFFNQKKMYVDEEKQAEMYHLALDFLESNGYQHYEISNWAKPGFRCRHNMNYWQNKEYIGVGASASSYLNGARVKNCCNVEQYIKLIDKNKDPVEERDYIDSAKMLAEELILKLRCRTGVNLREDINIKYGSKIDRLIEDDLLEKEGERIRLTKRGLLLANQVMKEFV
ncbi:MAG: radical SAM family heme chaperone HemW [Endomicrobiales bacterium]|nr:radical SAM family heme chaperone HemW [Endomicrobiales bacterium]